MIAKLYLVSGFHKVGMTLFLWTCKRFILFSDNVNILFFSGDMDNVIETPKLSQTHVYCHGHLACEICFQSCEKQFLKRDSFQTIFTQKFVIMLKEGRRKTIHLTLSKVTFLGNH